MRSISLAIVVLLSSMWLHAQRSWAAPAPSKVAAVTVYRGSALVTRLVEVPAGAGPMELVVTPLPPQTIDSSLYSEGTDGIRILSTRYRTRAIKDDLRVEVRNKEAQIRSLQNEAEAMQKQIEVINQNLALLAKMENFTAATMQQLAEKGLLSAETMIALSKNIMETRTAMANEQVEVQQSLRTNAEAVAFAQRELGELSAGSSKTERDAVIVIDKANAAAGNVRLNYLVSAATWRPQYKFRAAGDKEPVQVEYLAAVMQQSGEDWPDASVVLSTAEPLLSADAPKLLAMDLTVATQTSAGKPAQLPMELGENNVRQQQALRKEAQDRFNRNDYFAANASINTAGALQQTEELFSLGDVAQPAPAVRGGFVSAPQQREGPSVTYHLKPKFSVPSRNDEQLLEVARLNFSPSFFYKAVPVLSPHVYRQVNLTNTTEYVLLPGEATMYLGLDFVGRMQIPLVAIGEQFNAGFGVDPQLQVTRELIKKSRTVQGGNQVHELTYRMRLSSYKPMAANVQLWDRLPRAEAETVGITLVNALPSLSGDAAYLRVDRPQNLLRWDLVVEPGANGEKAVYVEYGFKMEYDRNVAIGNFITKG